MEIQFIYPFRNASNYIHEVESSISPDYDGLWEKHMIEPFWGVIAQWAPFDLSFMKPKPIEDIEALKKQVELLEAYDYERIKLEVSQVVKALPKMDEDPITVAIYPIDNGNKMVKNQQNGVLGTCVFGNIILNVNPLAEDWDQWLGYVFAHEYHHSVFGHYWFVIKGGLKGTYLEYMVNEGEADTFAESRYPTLKAQWVNSVEESASQELWEKYLPILDNMERQEHEKYMFGDEKLGLPWCAGYYFGNRIVKSYLAKHPNLSFRELLEINPDDIYRESGF